MELAEMYLVQGLNRESYYPLTFVYTEGFADFQAVKKGFTEILRYYDHLVLQHV